MNKINQRSRVLVKVIEKSSNCVLVDFSKGQTGFRYPLAQLRWKQFNVHRL